MKEIHKYYLISAPREEIYIALTNPFSIQLWTDAHAEMSTEPGSEFSILDGSILGKNLAFETNKKIEQEWYFGDQEQKSFVIIKLHEHKKGTSVELRHTNIPDIDYDNILDGWDYSYFGALADFFEK